jgi:4a-hydroxytetrahydrobiopterin dehydratase
MSEKITARQFHQADGVGDWRVVGGGASTFYPTDSFATAARLVQALAEIPAVAGRAPDVDLRPDGVFLSLFTTAPDPDGLSSEDVTLARLISAAAAELGLTAAAAELSNTVLVIDALDVSTVEPFWRAVLGYTSDDGELLDPYRRSPVVCFQPMDAPRPQRNRVHLDVWVPLDQAASRVARAIAAGGILVSDAMAPSWWVLADAEGNEACVATWTGTDGLGYP